ncbi:MAG: hypothetical protein K2X90_01030 [Candidatus Babeliaceae bacterium]|nr:hypothetical protein [Candidatus Babeliaceae bacterium]
MIFKNIEIFFLSASSNVRWGITFTILLSIFSSWWYVAFTPLRRKLKSSKDKFENACVLSREAEQNNLTNSLHFKTIKQKIAFAADHNHFLKELLKNGLKTRSVTIEKNSIAQYKDFKATTIKLIFTGTFENFYIFLQEHKKNYLCHWSKCACTQSAQDLLTIDATVVIYSK